MVKTEFDKDKLSLIIDLKIAALKQELKDGKDYTKVLYPQVKELYDQGKITDDELDQAQMESILDPMEVMAAFKTNKTTGFTYGQAVDIGHKIQFIYISYHQAQGRTDGMNLFRESMRPHEEGIEAIFEGTYDPDKLAVLQTLPEVDNWDHALGTAAYHKIF